MSWSQEWDEATETTSASDLTLNLQRRRRWFWICWSHFTEFVQFLLMKRLLKSLHLLKDSGDVVQWNEHLLLTPAGSDRQQAGGENWGNLRLCYISWQIYCPHASRPAAAAATRPPSTLSHSCHIDVRGVTSAGCVRGPTRADRSPLKKHK